MNHSYWRSISIPCQTIGPRPQWQAVCANGDEWANSRDSLALEVPSAAVFGERNYLLNCEHPDMQHLECGPIQSFAYDPRLGK